jgi:hypothetical protein
MAQVLLSNESDQSLSDFTRVPSGLKVASQAMPLFRKCARQLPSLLSFHCLTGTFPKIEIKEFSTAAGGDAFTEKIVLSTRVVPAACVVVKATRRNAVANNDSFFIQEIFIDKIGLQQ